MKTKYIIAASIAGAVAFGSLSTISAQGKDIPAPKDVAAAPANAQKTASGLASVVLKKGTGKVKPVAADIVTVHYSGWDKTGRMFDSSVKRGQPFTTGLNGVIKGWTEGLKLMVEGEKRRFWIPAAMAYGENPGGGRPGGDLCFDVELLSIRVKAPAVPKDVAAAPANAQKTASGLASVVLKPATGKISPKLTESVLVHYTGWTKDGTMFDSSVMRGKPLLIRPDEVVKGWTEGLQLMKVGEKRRMWIPAELAYGVKPKHPGAPAGPLCFDVELLQVLRAPENFNKMPENVVALEDGVKSLSLKPGAGAKPTLKDAVVLQYTGWDINGSVIDSSISEGESLTLPLDRVPPALGKAITTMKVGEKCQFWIPAKNIVGETPHPNAPKGPFCYQFELMEIVK